MGGRFIKQNQEFWAFPSQIPEAFRDLVKPVDTEKTLDDALIEEKKIKSVYTLNGRSDGKYDIIGPTGKVLNEQPLEKDEADKMISEL